MAEVEIDEGNKMLRENIEFLLENNSSLQEYVDDLNESIPSMEGLIIEIKTIQTLLKMQLSSLKIMTDTLNGHQQIIEGIINHINEE
jgi:hypothetical protein